MALEEENKQKAKYVEKDPTASESVSRQRMSIPSKGGNAKDNGTCAPWHFGQTSLGQRTPMTRAVPGKAPVWEFIEISVGIAEGNLAGIKEYPLSVLSMESASLGSFVVISQWKNAAQSCLGVTTIELNPIEMHDTFQTAQFPEE